MLEKIKNHSGLIVLAIILILLDIYHKELFLTILLFYGLLIKLFLSKLITGKLRKVLIMVIWTTFIGLFGLTFYVNYYLPHGASYPTGEIICQNDDRGPCGKEYKEDLRGLNIPDWAKFLRKSEGELLLFGLLFAGIVISSKEHDKQ